MMPAAVMIATVAEPCATRIDAATRYATTSGDMLDAASSLPAYSPDAGIDDHLLERPAAAHDQQQRTDGRAASTVRREIWLRSRPRAAPNAIMAARVAMSSAVNGWPKKPAAAFPGRFDAPAIDAPRISSTGSTRIRATSADGRRGFRPGRLHRPRHGGHRYEHAFRDPCGRRPGRPGLPWGSRGRCRRE